MNLSNKLFIASNLNSITGMVVYYWSGHWWPAIIFYVVAIVSLIGGIFLGYTNHGF
jgi:hypothetical protein